MKRILASLTTIAATVAIAGVAAPASGASQSRHAAHMVVSQQISPQSIADCTNAPTDVAGWWQDQGWPRHKNNQMYTDHNPSKPGGLRYINGSGVYKNISAPKLPPTASSYHEYDAQFRLSPDPAGRGLKRFVRETGTHIVYYSYDHYKHWCKMGKW